MHIDAHRLYHPPTCRSNYHTSYSAQAPALTDVPLRTHELCTHFKAAHGPPYRQRDTPSTIHNVQSQRSMQTNNVPGAVGVVWVQEHEGRHDCGAREREGEWLRGAVYAHGKGRQGKVC